MTSKTDLLDEIDLMRDEFFRIKIISSNPEVKGLCDRALSRLKRNVPVLDELEKLKRIKEYVDLGYILFENDGFNPEFYEIRERELGG